MVRSRRAVAAQSGRGLGHDREPRAVVIVPEWLHREVRRGAAVGQGRIDGQSAAALGITASRRNDPRPRVGRVHADDGGLAVAQLDARRSPPPAPAAPAGPPPPRSAARSHRRHRRPRQSASGRRAAAAPPAWLGFGKVGRRAERVEDADGVAEVARRAGAGAGRRWSRPELEIAETGLILLAEQLEHADALARHRGTRR